MKLRGVKISGVQQKVNSLLSIPGAFFLMEPGKLTTYRQGSKVNTVGNLIKDVAVTLTESGSSDLVYESSLPFFKVSTSSAIGDSNTTNFNFLHQAESWSLFQQFNPEVIPVGTGNSNVAFLAGTKVDVSSSLAGLAIRIHNNPVYGRSIGVSRNDVFDIYSTNDCYQFNQKNVLEIRFTKTGIQNKFELFCNNINVGTTTTTTTDKATGQSGSFNVSSSISSSKFKGLFGKLFIVKNAGKTTQQIIDESVMIRSNF
jgi:hypothetical protein